MEEAPDDDELEIASSRSDKNSIILPTNKRKINRDILTDAKFIESTSSQSSQRSDSSRRAYKKPPMYLLNRDQTELIRKSQGYP